MKDCLAHLIKYGTRHIDTETLRHVKRLAQERIANDEEIRADYIDRGLFSLVSEWDDLTLPAIADNNEAIRLIDAEFKYRS